MAHRASPGPRGWPSRSARAVLALPLPGVLLRALSSMLSGAPLGALLIPTMLTAQTAEFGYRFVTGAEVRYEQSEFHLTMVDGDTVNFTRLRQVIREEVTSVEADGKVGIRQTRESVHFEARGFDGVRQSWDSESGEEPVGPLAASMARQGAGRYDQAFDPASEGALAQLGPRLQAFPEGPVEVGDRWRWIQEVPAGRTRPPLEVEYLLAGFDEVDGRRVAILDGTMSGGPMATGGGLMGTPSPPPFSIRAVYDMERRVVLEYVRELEFEFEVDGQVGLVVHRSIGRLLP